MFVYHPLTVESPTPVNYQLSLFFWCIGQLDVIHRLRIVEEAGICPEYGFFSSNSRNAPDLGHVVSVFNVC